MDGWMCGSCIDGRINGWMDGWMDGRMDRWMDGWMDGWTDGWMDGWMDGQTDVVCSEHGTLTEVHPASATWSLGGIPKTTGHHLWLSPLSTSMKVSELSFLFY